MSYTQDGRPLRIDTPLGKDKLLLHAVHGAEEVSTPFHFSLECYSDDRGLSADALIGKGVTMVIVDGVGVEHYTHGLVRRFVQQGTAQQLVAYSAEIVPWFWFLSLNQDSRIFQKLTALEILAQVFDKSPGANYRISCSKSYPKRDYCVQYRESAFHFASRLMEEEGIFYFFEHAKGSHSMVLADSPSAAKSCGKARYTATRESWQDAGVVVAFDAEVAVQTGKVTLRDYDYLKPAVTLEEKTGGNPWEHYDYPGGFIEKSDGDRLARVRLESAESLQRVVRGSSTCPQFHSGFKWTLEEHYRKDLNADYLLLGVRTDVQAGDYTSWDEGGFAYRNEFVAIPATAPYHPPRITLRSRVEGSQTAVVVGKAGEEIWVDKYGRVKIQFHWDREGKKDENSSCWVRVASTWAGKSWGAIQLPRIGEEVIVDFLEGNPDQPIITGRVYNADRMQPYKLPDHQTQSGLLTRSSKGGGAANASELRFEDKKGSEEVFLHAEKDFNIEVENNRTTLITNNDDRTVDKGDDTHAIKKGKQTITIQGDQTLTIKQGDQLVTLDQGNQTITLTMGNLSTEVKMGNVDTDVKLGKHSTKAMQSIQLTVGQSSIKVDQMGVTIKGMMVKIEGQTITEVKGLMTKVEGSAMLTAKGGITMIN